MLHLPHASKSQQLAALLVGLLVSITCVEQVLAAEPEVATVSSAIQLKRIFPNDIWSNSRRPTNETAMAALLSAPAARELNLPHTVRMSRGCLVSEVDQRDIKMIRGAIIFHPDQDIVVSSPHAQISIARKSVVCVDVNKNRTNVMDFHDTSIGRVKVIADGSKVDLLPGSGAACGRKGSFEGELLHDGLARRRIVRAEYQHGMTAVTYEFSIVQAHSVNQLLSELRRSEESSDKKLMAKLIKTAAVIYTVTASHGVYQPSN